MEGNGLRIAMKKMGIVIAVAMGIAAVLGGCGSGARETASKVEGTEMKGEDAAAEASDGTVTLFLTRHGKTILNSTGRMQGWSDAPLTKDGADVAERLGKGLGKAGIQFDAVFSSDSGRAVETAELVLKNNGQDQLPVQKSDQLREVCYGKFEGATPMEAYHDAAELLGYADVNEMMGAVMGGSQPMPKAVSALAQSDETGMAESWETAQDRLMKGLNEIADQSLKQGDDQVLVVFHGMAISAVLERIDPSVQVGELGNASITKIVYDGEGFQIESVNDMSYIEEGEVTS